jgi:hypothetical protein
VFLQLESRLKDDELLLSASRRITRKVVSFEMPLERKVILVVLMPVAIAVGETDEALLVPFAAVLEDGVAVKEAAQQELIKVELWQGGPTLFCKIRMLDAL